MGKDNGSILRVIPLNELKDGFMPFLLFDHECIVFDCLRCSYILVIDQIDFFHVS